MFYKMRNIDIDFTNHKHLEYLLMYGGVNLLPNKQSLGSRRNKRRN